MDDVSLMQRAIALGRRAGDAGNTPFGAVIARDGEIISEAANSVAADGDPTAHAELKAVRAASKALGTADLSGLRLFSSGEPCPMCLGAIYWSRLSELIYGSSREDATQAGLPTAFLYEELCKDPRDRTLRSRRLGESEAADVLKDFVRSRPAGSGQTKPFIAPD